MLISNRFRFSSKSHVKINEIQSLAKRQVEFKLQKGIYLFEKIQCPICNTESSEIISEKDRYGLRYGVEICKKCGLIYTNPRMTQISYNEFYDLEYRRLYLGAESPQENYSKNQYKRGGEIFTWIQKLDFINLRNVKILEVGCSSGGILANFADRGCRVLGVDLDSKYLQYGREKFGIELIHGSLKDVPNSYNPDIIIYSHVLEHILNLEEELKNLKEISTPNTLLYIEVPGVKNIHSAYNGDILCYFQNAHTFHFSLTSLTNLLNKNQYELLYGDEFIKSIFQPVKYQKNNIIRSDYWLSLNYLKEVEERRKLKQFSSKVITEKIKNKIKGFFIEIYRFLK